MILYALLCGSESWSALNISVLKTVLDYIYSIKNKDIRK
jgi:hypothetical protein